MIKKIPKNLIKKISKSKKKLKKFKLTLSTQRMWEKVLKKIEKTKKRKKI